MAPLNMVDDDHNSPVEQSASKIRSGVLTHLLDSSDLQTRERSAKSQRRHSSSELASSAAPAGMAMTLCPAIGGVPTLSL